MHLVFRFILLSLIFVGGWANAQVLSRSGFPAPLESRLEKRPFPCDSRNVLFEENFSGNSLPTGWTALSRDTADLHPAIDSIYADNWQPIVDFKDGSNGAVASPSWHDFESRSIATDNWLLSPEIALGTNTCFSWVAYSQDRFHPESYEVLLSPTGSTALTDFTDTVEIVEEEGFFLLYRSANLSKYNGQTVRVAFRHTSVQKFMLVLDDVRFAEVEDADVGVNALLNDITGSTASQFDSTLLLFVLRNYGSDTLNLDNVRVGFRDGNQTVAEDTVRLLNEDKRMLAPNDTAHVSHPIFWNPSSDSSAFDLWIWSSLDTDAFSDNDTLYRRVGVGVSVTGINEDFFNEITVYPNPADAVLYIQGLFNEHTEVGLFDLAGKAVIKPSFVTQGLQERALNLAHIKAGIYMLKFISNTGSVSVRKILVK